MLTIIVLAVWLWRYAECGPTSNVRLPFMILELKLVTQSWLIMTRSYISHLDPHYVLALAETAALHQVQSLQDAIWRHLTSQTSIKVELSVSEAA